MYCLFVLFYALFVCKCALLPPGVNPIAVKYIISYHIISYRIISYHIMWCCAATEHSPPNTTSRYIPRLIFSAHFLLCSCLFLFCQLTRWRRALLDSLIIAHIFNKLSKYYARRRFITVFTTGSQLILILNHMNPYLLVYLRSVSILSSHLVYIFDMDCFLHVCPPKLSRYFSSYPNILILLGLITLIIIF